MSREELLLFRKTLLEYLDKGFIRLQPRPCYSPASPAEVSDFVEITAH
jgi:hypothetical protein